MSNISNIDNNSNKLLFSDFKFRCHRLGDLMTNLPGLTATEEYKLEVLSLRKIDAKKGTAKPLTEIMEKDLKELLAKKKKPDSLPAGAKSYLDSVFDEIYWKRKRILANKYLDKGLSNEQDVLQLHSDVDKDDYFKNLKRFYNEYIEGMPDNLDTEKVRDAKANFDLESFRKAHLTTVYLWQLKGYMWLTGLKKAELMYGLVNNPLHQIRNAENSAMYQFGFEENKEDDDFLLVKQQIERNMIFDTKAFKIEYPNYVFNNPVLDFDMPANSRVKKFQVTLDDNDILNMKTRVTLSRIYLVEKEIEQRKLDGTLLEKKQTA